MEIILLEDVESLGKEGQVVKVSDGYARNFLLPKSKGLEATAANMALWEGKREQIRAKVAKQKAQLSDLAARIGQEIFVIKHKVGRNEKLYGSVTAADIAASIAAQGINIDRRSIQLAEPIKSLGEFSVPIKLPAEITATAKIQVIKDE